MAHLSLSPARARTKRLCVFWIIHRYTPTDVCRVDTADGRSPGSRIGASPCLPGGTRRQWLIWTRLPAHSCGGSCGIGRYLRAASPHSLFALSARDRRGHHLAVSQVNLSTAGREFELGHVLFGLTNLRVMEDRRNDRYYDGCVSLIVDFVSHVLRILCRPAKNCQAKRSNFDHSGSRAVVVPVYSSR